MTSNVNTRAKLVEQIEHNTGRKVAIDTDDSDQTLAKCKPQDQSPLFSLFPREIRDLIWAFATVQFEDKANPYDKNKFYYRPGNTAKRYTDCNLLLTCRRIWLEAHSFAMLQAEHSFWYYRAAPDGRSKTWMASLTPLNRKYFGTLHLYAQMYAIEGLRDGLDGLRDYFLPDPSRFTEDFQPSKFHVTIRHTDWWHWEEEAPLRFKYQWFQAMLDSPDLRRTETLVLELETLDYKVPQLNPIVNHIRSLQSKEYDTHIVNGEPARTKFILTGEPEVTTWTGPTNIDGHAYIPYKNKTELNYHVVTLTWRLKFPQHPKAHVPHLRLAPQVHSKRPIDTSHRDSLDSWSDTSSRSRDSDRAMELGIPEREPRPWYSRTRYAWQQGQRYFFHRHRRDDSPDSYADTDDEDVDDENMGGNLHYVQERSAWQARVTEWMGRRRFWKQMMPLRRRSWERRFREAGSLLRLEDR